MSVSGLVATAMFTEIDTLRKNTSQKTQTWNTACYYDDVLDIKHQYTKATIENNQTNTTMTRWLVTLHGLKEGQGNLPLISLGLERKNCQNHVGGFNPTEKY